MHRLVAQDDAVFEASARGPGYRVAVPAGWVDRSVTL